MTSPLSLAQSTGVPSFLRSSTLAVTIPSPATAACTAAIVPSMMVILQEAGEETARSPHPSGVSARAGKASASVIAMSMPSRFIFPLVREDPGAIFLFDAKTCASFKWDILALPSPARRPVHMGLRPRIRVPNARARNVSHSRTLTARRADVAPPQVWSPCGRFGTESTDSCWHIGGDMHCTNGHPMKEGANFCSVCAAPPASATQPSPPFLPAYAQPLTPQQQATKRLWPHGPPPSRPQGEPKSSSGAFRRAVLGTWRFYRRRSVKTQIIIATLIVAVSVTAGLLQPDPSGVASITSPAPALQDEPATVTQAEPAQDKGDASAQLACTHFHNIRGDVQAGILTDAELRKKLKEVYNDAWVSETPGVAPAATAMLRAITQGDETEFPSAVANFIAACDPVKLL
jgi:hypothetical protein